VKILSNGTFNKKVTIDGCAVSAAAQTKVEAAGGSVKSA
jgi:ribosomal protein L15